jgi:bifunctional ADP-heptose synthase (sugar kinase/adenylyltransferase)
MIVLGLESVAGAEDTVLFFMTVAFSVSSAFVSACLFGNQAGRPRIITVEDCECTEPSRIKPP